MKQTLFHQCHFEPLKKIMADNGFKASYCHEINRYSYNYINKGNLVYEIFIPMVSFSDKFLADSPYGDCSIELNIEWARRNELNPVLYLEKHSKISKSIRKILTKFSDNEQNELNSASIILLQSIKNIEGNYNNNPVNHYKEREWRYIPNLKGSKYPDFFYEYDSEKYSFLKEKPHINEKQYLLEFNLEDIEHIFLSNENQKENLKEFCKEQNLECFLSKICIK